MRNSQPVVSTAKVRGIVKKNGIGYVDATRKFYPSIAKGVHVWQFGSHVLFEVYAYGEEVKRQEILNQFTEVLANEGLAVSNVHGDCFEVVKAGN